MAMLEKAPPADRPVDRMAEKVLELEAENARLRERLPSESEVAVLQVAKEYADAAAKFKAASGAWPLRPTAERSEAFFDLGDKRAKLLTAALLLTPGASPLCLPDKPFRLPREARRAD